MAARKGSSSQQADAVEADTNRLDLDAEREANEVKRLRVKVGGEWNTIRGPHDLPLAEKEELRLLILDQHEVAINKALTRQERKAALDDIEDGIIALAFLGGTASLRGAPEGIVDPFVRSRIVELFINGLPENVLLPIAMRVVQEANQRAMLARRAAILNRASPTNGEPQPETDEPTERSSSTSSSAIAAG